MLARVGRAAQDNDLVASPSVSTPSVKEFSIPLTPILSAPLNVHGSPSVSATVVNSWSSSSSATIINPRSPSLSYASSPLYPSSSPSPSCASTPLHTASNTSVPAHEEEFFKQMWELQELRVRYNLQANFGLLVRRREADTVRVEEHVDVRLFLAPSSIPDAGMGVFAAQSIGQGTFLREYTGEVLLRDTFEERIHAAQTSGRYAFRLGSRWVIDAEHQGNLARFINHSCKVTNVVAHQIVVQGTLSIGFFALREIGIGEELLYNYEYGPHEGNIPCKCTPNCTAKL
jgi:hypothetical protein